MRSQLRVGGQVDQVVAPGRTVLVSQLRDGPAALDQSPAVIGPMSAGSGDDGCLPVFVDPTGRRRRAVQLAAVGAVLAVFGTGGLVTAALLGAPIAPSASLPEPIPAARRGASASPPPLPIVVALIVTASSVRSGCGGPLPEVARGITAVAETPFGRPGDRSSPPDPDC